MDDERPSARGRIRHRIPPIAQIRGSDVGKSAGSATARTTQLSNFNERFSVDKQTPSPPFRNRNANAARRRFYAADRSKSPQQRRFRSHDPDFAVGDLHPLSERAKMVAPVVVPENPIRRDSHGEANQRIICAGDLPLDCSCVCRKLRFEHIGDVRRRPWRAIRCVQSAEPGARGWIMLDQSAGGQVFEQGRR